MDWPKITHDTESHPYPCAESRRLAGRVASFAESAAYFLREHYLFFAMQMFKEALRDFDSLHLKLGLHPPSLAQSVALKTIVERARVCQAIEEEPECPGDMPSEMWESIRGDRRAMTEVIRSAIRATKQNIIHKVQNL